MLSKLDNSTPGKTVPPTGTTEAGEAVRSKGRSAGVTFKGVHNPKDIPVQAEKPAETMAHKGPGVSMASPTEIKAVEESATIAEESEEEGVAIEDIGKGEVAGQKSLKTKDATAATDKAGELPGTKTQEQRPGAGEKVGESVAD